MPLISTEVSGIHALRQPALRALTACARRTKGFYQNMKSKSIESLAADNAALQKKVAALRAKLARPNAGRKARKSTPLTTKQRNDLRSAAKRIAKAWDGFDLPDETWLTARLDALPQELRVLRDDGDWREIVEKYVRRKQAAELIA